MITKYLLIAAFCLVASEVIAMLVFRILAYFNDDQ
jgi:hypothetical protein